MAFSDLLAGGASLIGGLFGSSPSGNVQLPPIWQMPNMGAAADAAYAGIGKIPGADIGNWTLPLAQQTASSLYYNPYAGGFQGGANIAAGLGQNAALNQYGGGGAIMGAGLGLLPYGGSILQTGFDPQNELYARTLGKLQDQTGANLANSGVLNSPYGQGVQANTLSNFNIDWQNTQLGRQLAALTGAGGAFNNAGGLVTQGGQLQSGGAGDYARFSGLPYMTAQGIGTGQLGALTGLQGVGAGAQGLATTPVDEYLKYLGVGNAANQVSNQTAGLYLKQAEDQFKQNQALGSGIGGGLAGIAKGLPTLAGIPGLGFLSMLG